MRLRDVRVEWPGVRPPTPLELTTFRLARRRYLGTRESARILGVRDRGRFRDWLVAERARGGVWVAGLWGSAGDDLPILLSWVFYPTLPQLQAGLASLLPYWLDYSLSKEVPDPGVYVELHPNR